MKNIFNAPVAEVVAINQELPPSFDLGEDVWPEESYTYDNDLSDQ